MPRRSWRDLAADPAPGGPRGPGAPPPGADRPDVGPPGSAPPHAGLPGPGAPGAAGPSAGPELLHRAAPDGSRLADLLAEREQLESVLAGLTGPGETPSDPRFPVTGLRERRAEIASWARARDASRTGRRRAADRAAATGTGLRGFTGAGTAARSQLLAPLRSGLGRYDQVRSALDRSERMLERPQQLADSLTAGWEHAKDEITGPMDRVGPYAEARDRVLDLDIGGCGDLAERAEAARRRALERRAEQDREERRAARRHQQRHERRSAEARDAERLDRRIATGRGV